MEKYRTAGHATDGSIIGLMRVACWMIEAKDTHSEYAIFLHGNNGYARAPYCYIHTYIASPVIRDIT